MDTPTPKAGLGVLGVGAAACAACCAGPILGFVAATGIASALGAVAFGVVGLVAVLAVAGVLLRRRRRKAGRCAPAAGAVPLDAPALKTRRWHCRWQRPEGLDVDPRSALQCEDHRDRVLRRASAGAGTGGCGADSLDPAHR